MEEYKEYILPGLPDSEIKIDHNLIFILMPFKKKFDKLFQMIDKTVEEYNNDKGSRYYCRRADTVYKAGRIMATIWNKIREANIIIADLSGSNKNVYFELGLSYAVGRYTILISSDRQKKLPFDINQENCIFYENNKEGLSELKKKIKEAIDESRCIIDFERVSSPSKAGWLSVQGTTVGDTLEVRKDEELQRNVLYTDVDLNKVRYRDKYKWAIDYPISVSPSRTNVIFRVKAIDNQRLTIYFRIRVKESPDLDFWILYTYKHQGRNGIETSTDKILRYDPNWPNEIVYDLEKLEKKDWSGWVKFKRNLKEDFSKAIDEFHAFIDNYNFHHVIGIRIRGAFYLDFIEFK